MIFKIRLNVVNGVCTGHAKDLTSKECSCIACLKSRPFLSLKQTRFSWSFGQAGLGKCNFSFNFEVHRQTSK